MRVETFAHHRHYLRKDADAERCNFRVCARLAAALPRGGCTKSSDISYQPQVHDYCHELIEVK